MAPPEASDKMLLPGWQVERDNAAVVLHPEPVYYGKAAAGQRSPAMNDSARKSSAVPFIITRGFPTALIMGRPGVAEDIHVPALGAVEEGLPYVAEHRDLSPFGNLAELVLRVAVHVHGKPVIPDPR